MASLLTIADNLEPCLRRIKFAAKMKDEKANPF